MFQELLHLVPIKKSVAVRKDNVTVYSVPEPRSSTSEETSELFTTLNIHDYRHTQAFYSYDLLKGSRSANKPNLR